MTKRKFELVTKYQDQLDLLPKRATKGSAGYDFKAAETTLVPSIWTPALKYYINNCDSVMWLKNLDNQEIIKVAMNYITPTLVPTGVKASMPNDNVLILSNRSSSPIKRHLILANGVGVIDSDYYNNQDNEGHIFGQFINIGPKDYVIKRGDRIMQGLFMPNLLTADDDATSSRTGGFGSTGDN